jgi:hypothetical protein
MTLPEKDFLVYFLEHTFEALLLSSKIIAAVVLKSRRL